MKNKQYKWNVNAISHSRAATTNPRPMTYTILAPSREDAINLAWERYYWVGRIWYSVDNEEYPAPPELALDVRLQ